MTFHQTTLAALALLLAVGGAAAPAFAQGAYQSPPAPNSNNSGPASPNSAPVHARTLPPGTTGIERMDTVAVTRVSPR